MNLLSGKKWFTWPRLACLAITGVILVLIFRQVGSTAFIEALRKTRPLWVVLAVLAYGLAIWLASLRWHLALRLTDCAIHLSASIRLFFIGHFFYVVFFGAAGGDIAKSVAYARYYRFRIAQVIAAAPLDRVLGLGGNIILAVFVVTVAFLNGGFQELKTLTLYHPGTWSLAAGLALVLVVAVVFFWRPEGEHFLAQTLRALRSGAARLVLNPSVAAPGTLFAFLSITSLTAVFALNLRAVSQAPLPWAQSIWTFPVITLIGSIPFTFGGAGLREAAALAFLGLYGVPPGECVAAALLTLVEKLLWGVVGASVLWREESLRVDQAVAPLPQTVSILITPVGQAAAIPETVRRARANREVIELIVIDDGNHAASVKAAAQLGCRVWPLGPSGGNQARPWAAHPTGDVVMLLQSGTWLPPLAAHAALNCLRDETVVAGGFWEVSNDGLISHLGSRCKCALRLLLRRRIAHEQAIFIRRGALEKVEGIADYPGIGEIELCQRLRKVGRLALAEGTVARRTHDP